MMAVLLFNESKGIILVSLGASVLLWVKLPPLACQSVRGTFKTRVNLKCVVPFIAPSILRYGLSIYCTDLGNVEKVFEFKRRFEY
jgi:hypothetical protein